jgi:membrane-associated phospholipid phosphatase
MTTFSLMFGLRCEGAPQQDGGSSFTASSDATPGNTTNADAAVSDPTPAVEDDSEARNNELGINLLKNLMSDQESIWTSPFHLRWGDGDWLLPMAELTGGFIATDRAVSHSLSNNPTTLNHYRSLSNYGLYGFAAATGGFYLWGKITHDDHRRETGLLAGEAILDSIAVNSALEYAFQRERPYQDQGSGRFFDGGSSFPSDHSMMAWSAASVIAHEYPGPLTDLLAYGGATAISMSRVMGKEHFPSDVFVGAALGWLIGQQVYRKHHDPELGGTGWEDLSGGVEAERNRDRRHMGSPSVALDSWVYPALDRLAALGYISTSIEGLKPWTRIECARLTEEAQEALSDDSGAANREATGLVTQLENEFGYELDRLSGGRNRTANLESAYTRTVSISGPVLNDSYHFGQTLSYDFGRPYETGTNFQEGGEFSAAAGAIVVDVRAEFQHAPSAPALPQAALNFIGTVDQEPVPPNTPIAAINRPQMLDGYIAANLGNFEIIVGRQSLSWGPGPGGSLIFSDNAEPIGMVRLVNPEPFHLPGIFKYLGPARLDQFMGRLGGHEFVQQPFLYGQKLNFKPIPALELGFSRTTLIGGYGADGTPFTTGNFIKSFFGQTGVVHGVTGVPGASSSSMDWTFYVPHVRNYLVFYGELYTRDNIQPLQNPSFMAYRPGLEITHFPKLSKLDLHIEATSTESAGRNGAEGHLNYYDFEYREGWTNYGFLIGNPVGRMGENYQGWLTYWISPRNTLQFNYKNNRVDSAFVPGGGAWQDYSVANEFHFHSGIYVKSELQYENISHYPILFTSPQRNVAAILEFGFMPERKHAQTANN